MLVKFYEKTLVMVLSKVIEQSPQKGNDFKNISFIL